ncbi:DUF2752 domain-containing protein [Nocardioides sp. MH1]|uniref:DUF2752 domain-containing protein n=1 Tax=Nocardioides sp. MH1 TaxID=3242490 RepID=UPI003520F9A4
MPTTPLTEERFALLRRQPRLSASDVAAVGGVAGIGVAFLLSPDHIEDGPVICPFRALTGLPCPGCGLTRSWVYAAHGWWRESFASHPFGLVLVAGILALAVTVARRRARHEAPPELDRLLKHPVVLAIGAIWLTFGAVRLVLAI